MRGGGEKDSPPPRIYLFPEDGTMIISNTQSLFQNIALSEQNKASGSVREASKARPEAAREAPPVSAPVPSSVSLGKLLARIDALRGVAVDPTSIIFLPYFPIATYHRLDMLMEIRAVQDEAAKLAAEKREAPPWATKKLSETSSDGEIREMLQSMFQFRAEAEAMMKQAETEAAPKRLSIKA